MGAAPFVMSARQLLLVLLAVLSKRGGQARCTDDCQCSDGGREVICNNNQTTYRNPLDTLPRHIKRLKISNYHNLSVPYQYLNNFNLTSVTVRDCDISTPFKLPSTLTDLNLGGNQLKYSLFPFLASQHLFSLVSLFVPKNEIVIPTFNLLRITEMPQLQKLVLSDNTVPFVSQHLFSNLTSLQNLRMENCQIERIHPDAFQNLRRLRKLNLSRNRLKVIPGLLLRYQSELQEISMAFNFLTTIPPFHGPPVMGLVDFSYNRITNVRNWTIPNLLSVLSLILQGNKINELPAEFLKKTQVIFTLDMSYNRLTRIEDSSLARIPLVNIVNLSNNKLQRVTSKMFQGLRRLRALYLNSNKISRIDNGAFRGLRVAKLFLHDNSLTILHRPFQGLIGYIPKITLFDNKLYDLSNATAYDLPSRAHLYISCQTTKAIAAPIDSTTFISCGTTHNMQFTDIDYSSALSLQKAGFQCNSKEDVITQYLRSLTCRGCSPGSYNAGESECHVCQRGGYYQDQTAQSQCKKCNNGQYVDHFGGTSPYDCQICPPGTDTNLFAYTRACYCLPGHARRDRFGPCNECTEQGIICFNGTQHLAPGYWWKWHTTDDANKYICFQKNLQVNGEAYDVNCNAFYTPLPKIYRCPFQAACLGGMQATCHTNYTGPLCAACSPGYYPTIVGCLSCPSKLIIVLQILTSFLLVMICIMVLRYTCRWSFPTEDNRTERTLSDAIASVTKIVLTYYQLLAVIVRLLYDLQWPHLMVQISSVLYRYALQLFSIPSLKCIHPALQLNAYGEMILAVAAVLLLPILVWVAERIHFHIAVRYRPLSDPAMEKDKLDKAYWTSLLGVYFVVYPGICQRIFQIMPFNCRSICLDRAAHICQSYLRVDFTARCPASQPNNWKFVYIGFAALIFPPLFPACLLALMWKGKKEEDTNTPFSQQTSFATAVTRFCYENYKAEYWYWEVLELLRKLLFAVGFAFFGLDSKTNLGYLIVISGIYTVIYAYVKPIQHKYEHYLQMFSLSGLFLNLCLCVLLSTSARRDNFKTSFASERKSLTIIFLVTNLLPILVVLARAVKSLFCWCLWSLSRHARENVHSLI